jgi:hypothetical protein
MSRKRKGKKLRERERNKAESQYLSVPGEDGLSAFQPPFGMTFEEPLSKEERTILRRRGLVVEKDGQRYVIRQGKAAPKG